MKILADKIAAELKDYIFPLFCLGCGQEGLWLCPDCGGKILRASSGCPVCAARNLSGLPCGRCRSALDQIKAIIFYQEDGLSGQAIKLFKYSYAEDIYVVFEKIIIEYLHLAKDSYKDIDCIVPVPLHPRRYAERGFNQAQIFAQTVAEILDKQLLGDLLLRSRYTAVQAKLTKSQRIKNIKDAFALKRDFSLKSLNILLVDDVFTTGATMQECARVLKKAGARAVRGLALSRGNQV